MSNNFITATNFLIETLFTLYIGAVMLRFLLQLVRADYYNPLSQLVIKVTNPLLLPLRKVIPGYAKLDLAALVLALLLSILQIVILLLLNGLPLNPTAILTGAVMRLIALVINLYTFTIIIQVVLSWVSPGYHPIASALWSLNEPLLRPVRRLIPPLGGLDLSPLFVLLGLQVLRILIAGY